MKNRHGLGREGGGSGVLAGGPNKKELTRDVQACFLPSHFDSCGMIRVDRLQPPSASRSHSIP